jgi:hypothetical protein
MDADNEEYSVFLTAPYVSSLLEMVLCGRWEEMTLQLCSPQEPLPLKSLGFLLSYVCAIPESPLVIFKTILEVGGSEAAAFTDSDGSTPLHLAVMQADTRPELIQLLVDAAPKTVRQRDIEGLLPIEILTQKILMKEERLRYIITHEQSATEPSRTGRIIEANWQCAYILVTAQGRRNILSSPAIENNNNNRDHHYHHHADDAADQEDDQEGVNNNDSNDDAAAVPARQLMLHACLKASDIPLALIERAMKRYHDQLHELDELGNLPLHLVAAQSQAGDDNDTDTEDLLGEILNAYQPAASVRNNNGAMPLDLAIASGRQWETGIRKLLQVHPDALVETTVSHIPDTLWPLVFATLLRHDAPSLVFGMLAAKPGLVRCHASD